MHNHPHWRCAVCTDVVACAAPVQGVVVAGTPSAMVCVYVVQYRRSRLQRVVGLPYAVNNEPYGLGCAIVCAILCGYCVDCITTPHCLMRSTSNIIKQPWVASLLHTTDWRRPQRRSYTASSRLALRGSTVALTPSHRRGCCTCGWQHTTTAPAPSWPTSSPQ